MSGHEASRRPATGTLAQRYGVWLGRCLKGNYVPELISLCAYFVFELGAVALGGTIVFPLLLPVMREKMGGIWILRV